jgi:trehalose 6-phosphate synthase
VVAPLVDQLTLRLFVRDLDMRSSLIANTIQEPLQDKLKSGKKSRVVEFFNSITKDERLYAIGYCASPTGAALVSRTLPPEIRCSNLERWEGASDHLLQGVHGPLHVAIKPMASAATPAGRLVLVHDMSFVTHRSEETNRYVFYFFMGLAVVVSLVTVIIAQLSWRGWMAGMRSLLRGEGLLWQLAAGKQPSLPEFKPIARDLQRLIRELESETRTRDESQVTWSADALRAILHGELRGEDVIVVSNREPYMHQRRGDHIEVQQPASGLVTALEPVMRACSGVWVAHGGGSADRDTADARGRLCRDS